jgi:hypothetical protein
MRIPIFGMGQNRRRERQILAALSDQNPKCESEIATSVPTGVGASDQHHCTQGIANIFRWPMAIFTRSKVSIPSQLNSAIINRMSGGACTAF